MWYFRTVVLLIISLLFVTCHEVGSSLTLITSLPQTITDMDLGLISQWMSWDLVPMATSTSM